MKYSVLMLTAAWAVTAVPMMDEVFYDLQGRRHQINDLSADLTAISTGIQYAYKNYEDEYKRFEKKVAMKAKFLVTISQFSDEKKAALENHNGGVARNVLQKYRAHIEDLKIGAAVGKGIGCTIGAAAGAVAGAKLAGALTTSILKSSGKIGPAALWGLTNTSKWVKGCGGAVGGAVGGFAIECIISSITGAVERDNLDDQIQTLKNRISSSKKDQTFLEDSLSGLRDQIAKEEEETQLLYESLNDLLQQQLHA